MPLKDIKLRQDSDGIYDIHFENGDFALTSGLETSMILSIHCERRDESIEDSLSRRGWAGNQLQEIDGFEQGSLVWTLYQARADEDSVTNAQDFLQDAFQWYIDDNIAKDVEVEVSLDNEEIIAKIILTRNDNTQEVRYYDLWINTINNN